MVALDLSTYFWTRITQIRDLPLEFRRLNLKGTVIGLQPCFFLHAPLDLRRSSELTHLCSFNNEEKGQANNAAIWR